MYNRSFIYHRTSLRTSFQMPRVAKHGRSRSKPKSLSPKSLISTIVSEDEVYSKPSRSCCFWKCQTLILTVRFQARRWVEGIRTKEGGSAINGRVGEHRGGYHTHSLSTCCVPHNRDVVIDDPRAPQHCFTALEVVLSSWPCLCEEIPTVLIVLRSSVSPTRCHFSWAPGLCYLCFIMAVWESGKVEWSGCSYLTSLKPSSLKLLPLAYDADIAWAY